ncbi:hypothetical protein K474DRAFT_1772847 [Panus rudis PR-1116 ss-1]|nr:hypothetical protein K474DRAFT_1772847 [Panus rudis PR-1116 ss-1]
MVKGKVRSADSDHIDLTVHVITASWSRVHANTHFLCRSQTTMAALRKQLLQLAIPLVKSHGFTRQALAESVLCLPQPHQEILSDTAVSALFGEGDEARRTLINAWLDDARMKMHQSPSRTIKDVLATRLRENESVLGLLPEAFAVLATPSNIPVPDSIPGLAHAAKVADEACRVVGDSTVGPAWYARRGSLAAVYGAAELHQLTSPKTAYDFLDNLLDSSTKVESAVADTTQFASYIVKSWAGLIKSRGILL